MFVQHFMAIHLSLVYFSLDQSAGQNIQTEIAIHRFVSLALLKKKLRVLKVNPLKTGKDPECDTGNRFSWCIFK